VQAKFEVRSFTRSLDNRGYPKKIGQSRDTHHSLFSKIFNGQRQDNILFAFVPMDPLNVLAKCEVSSFTRS